jgi:prepilin-type N-terminal cleavage/methylation domain-containing protein
MVANNTEGGFTIVEVLVTIVITALFVTMYFSAIITNSTQQGAITQRAAANDIAITNLKKISTRTSPLLSTVSCGPSNDLTATTPGGGTTIDLNTYGGGADYEPLTGTTLPSLTTQTLTIKYPRGCIPAAFAPIEVVSTVNYVNGIATHATYIE